MPGEPNFDDPIQIFGLREIGGRLPQGQHGAGVARV